MMILMCKHKSELDSCIQLKNCELCRVRFIWLLGLIMVASCHHQESTSEHVVFHYNQHNNITSLDPAFAKSQNNIWAANHLYNTLLVLDDSLQVCPSLAKSWEVSEDARTYTFTIRDKITFHRDPSLGDRRRFLTATDVEYSFNRLVDTTVNSPGSWIFADRIAGEKPFEAINDTTFILRLKEPFSPTLSLLTMQYASIIPKEAVAYYGVDFYKHPVGTGPFRMKRWLSNQGLFLERNPDYFDWQGHPKNNLEGVRTSFIGERSFAFLELVNQRIDFFSGLESSFIHTALDEKGQLKEIYKNRIKFSKSPYLNFEYLGINQTAEDAHPLLKEKSFRQALNYGIDREVMLATLRKNIGVPADAGVIPRGLPSYNPTYVNGYAYNPSKARDLLAYLDQSLLDIPLVIHTSKDYLDLTTFIAKQWENIGLKTKIEVSESAILRNAMRTGIVGMFRASWIADYPDGENFLSMFYSSNPAPPNYTRYHNDNFDILYRNALSNADEEDRIRLYNQMDSMLVDDAPVIFLFYDEISQFSNNKISGLSTNALNLLHVTDIHKGI